MGPAHCHNSSAHQIELELRYVLGRKIDTWYFDDGNVCGSITNLEAVLSIMEQEGPTSGQNLN